MIWNLLVYIARIVFEFQEYIYFILFIFVDDFTSFVFCLHIYRLRFFFSVVGCVV